VLRTFLFPRPSNHIPTQRTQLRHAIANAALSPAAPPSTSDPGFASPPPVGTGLPLPTLKFYDDEANKYPCTGSLPLPATAAANRPRNEAIPMVKYGMKNSMLTYIIYAHVGPIVLLLTIAIIIAVGIFVRP